ncbi:MAG TPA: FAD-dependent oxidoreductase [Polyangiaceae bacterium]|jgi:glutamate synthase (NADPH/NADH) small chain
MTAWTEKLPGERAETALADKKPLMDAAEARLEAERCLYCADAPCTIACPTSIDVPGFIKRIASGNVRGSARTILEQNILGYSCARVCPVEVLCEGSCVYTAWQDKPIAIGRLQRYATENGTLDLAAPVFGAKASTGKRVACVGAGPASLAFAAYLAMEGHKAVVFEKRALPGGLNTTGVAPYKLHADDAAREVEWVQSLGVEIRTGVEVGKDVTGAQLLAEYDAVFLGLGLGDDNRLGIPGEDGPGVVGATAWIEQMKLAKGTLPKLGHVVVVGGGNTALDVARECALLGAEAVMMVYRRGIAEMSGYDHELAGARKEGVIFVDHATPLAVVRDAAGAVRALRVSKGGAEVDLPAALVALAIGQSKLRSVASQFPGVALDARGCVVADAASGVTGNLDVFSGGDCVNGGKEVVNAVADGRNAARFLHAKWSTSHG